MNPLQNVVYFVVFLGVLVTVHELGHFLVAKACGVKVLRFSVGFGPRIFGFTKGETEYRIAWIPLGGYVKMAGEQPQDEVSPEDAKRSFLNQAPWKRAAILVAGPAFNLIFPILAYFLVFLHPVTVESTRIGYVEPEMPAALAGLKPGDRLVSVEGHDVRTFKELPEAFIGLFDRPVSVTYERDGERHTVQMTPQKTVDVDIVEKVERGLIGVTAEPRAAVIGVPPASAADVSGLRTFDRIAKIGPTVIDDELVLRKVVAAIPVGTPMELTVLRSKVGETGGARFIIPEIVTMSVPRAEGEGFAALGGAEVGDLYLWNVEPGTPAAAAGLKRGDRLITMDGRTLRSAQFALSTLHNLALKPFKIEWQSGSEQKSAELAQVSVKRMDELKNEFDIPELGVHFRSAAVDPLAAGPRPELIQLNLSVREAMMQSLKIVPTVIRKIALVIGKLFTGDVPMSAFGGPGTLYMVASKSAEAGIDSFMAAMAMVSVNLGLMNLLPIPVLDGFGLLAALWEGIRRRPIPAKARDYANMVGFVMLMLVMVMAVRNDITRFLR